MSKRPGDPGYAAGWCIHYLGISDGKGGFIKACEKGVEYARFRQEGVPYADRAPQPCFLTDKGNSKAGALPCEHLRRPTPDEIAAHEVWAERRIQKTLTAISASASFRKESKGRSTSQVIDCPVCKTGKLSMTHAACNGHVHGHCSTPECVSWME